MTGDDIWGDNTTSAPSTGGLGPSSTVPQEAEKLIDPYTEGINLPGSKKPILVLFGPSQIGKTVALLRLVSYLKEHQRFSFQIESGARSDAAYQTAVDAFNQALIDMDAKKPPRTKNLDFLLLTARQNGVQWHVLEAPGEHFFDPDKPNVVDEYPKYLSQVVEASQKKIYVFFFEENMFKDAALRRAYASRLGVFVNAMIDAKRDRVLVLYNKINNNIEHRKANKAVAQELKDEIFKGDDYQSFSLAVTENGTKLKHVPIVPFYSGTFHGGDTGSWTKSPDKFPATLWDALHGLIHKKFTWF